MFFGKRSLVLFEGVVEDRKDPLLLGRVRVRPFAWSDEDKSAVPTESLPWGMPLLPADDANNVTTYKEGDWVVGYWRDGKAGQFPVILGKLPRIPEIPSDPSIGFNDPTPDDVLESKEVPRPPEMIPPPSEEDGESGGNEQEVVTGKDPNVLPVQNTATGQLVSEFGTIPFPLDINQDGQYDAKDAELLIDPDGDGRPGVEDDQFFTGDIQELGTVPVSRYPLEDRLNEPTVSRLARNENLQKTIVGRKRGDLQTGGSASYISSGIGTDDNNEGESFGEPETPYDAVYPYNKVVETESGHIVELDDTPGAERTNYHHRAGTFEEVHPNGLKVDKVVDDRYVLTTKDHNHVSKGITNITGEGGVRILGVPGIVVEAGGTYSQSSGENTNIKVGGDSNRKVEGDDHQVIAGDVKIVVEGNIYLKVEGDYQIDCTGDLLLKAANIIHQADLRHSTSAPLIEHGGVGDAGVISNRAAVLDFAGITAGTLLATEATIISGVEGLPSVQIPPFLKENEAGNQAAEVVASDSSSPKPGYLWNDDSMVPSGSPVTGDLWKPESDSTGNVVVLTPDALSCTIYEALPTGELQEDVVLQYKNPDNSIVTWTVVRPAHKKGRRIETGVFSGIANGDRRHYRFNRPGSGYPSVVILEMGDRDYLIVDASERHEAL